MFHSPLLSFSELSELNKSALGIYGQKKTYLAGLLNSLLGFLSRLLGLGSRLLGLERSSLGCISCPEIFSHNPSSSLIRRLEEIALDKNIQLKLPQKTYLSVLPVKLED